MPRSTRWFAHDSNMRFDARVEQLVDEFGTDGDLYWRRLLEVRSLAAGDIVASIRNLFKQMNLRESFDTDLETWILAARRLRLISARRERGRASAKDVEWRISVTGWDTYAARAGTPDYERDKKRRQRGSNVPGQSGDKEQVSRDKNTQTDIQTKSFTDKNNNRLESVGNVGEASADGVVDPASPNGKADLVTLMVAVGVKSTTAKRLARDHPDRCAVQLEWLPQRDARDPAGTLVSAIQDDWAPPSGPRRAGREYPDVTAQRLKSTTKDAS